MAAVSRNDLLVMIAKRFTTTRRDLQHTKILNILNVDGVNTGHIAKVKILMNTIGMTIKIKLSKKLIHLAGLDLENVGKYQKDIASLI